MPTKINQPLGTLGKIGDNMLIITTRQLNAALMHTPPERKELIEVLHEKIDYLLKHKLKYITLADDNQFGAHVLRLDALHTAKKKLESK